MIKGELFSQPFIPKLLDGTKIRTSRPIKAPVLATTSKPEIVKFSDGVCTLKWDGSHGTIGGFDVKPKYRPGDIMYVRETWQSFFSEEVTPNHQQGPLSFSGIPAETAKGHYMYFYYRADGEVPPDPKYGKANWSPSIHMPKRAARIFLRVTDVKVQHIDNMTEQDAVDDGFVDQSYTIGDGKFEDVEEVEFTALDSFKEFWIRQYGPEACWMWVYYFERISREEAHDEG